jgi:hypothetical protein
MGQLIYLLRGTVRSTSTNNYLGTYLPTYLPTYLDLSRWCTVGKALTQNDEMLGICSPMWFRAFCLSTKYLPTYLPTKVPSYLGICQPSCKDIMYVRFHETNREERLTGSGIENGTLSHGTVDSANISWAVAYLGTVPRYLCTWSN